MNTDRLASSLVGARFAEAITSECLARRPHGIEVIGLGAVFGLAGRPVELDHPLAQPRQRDAETAPVAGGALDRPRPFGVDAVAVDELDGLGVANSGRREPVVCRDTRRVSIDDGEGDPVAIGIDADHMMDEFCKHERGNLRVSVSVGAGLGGTATPGL